MSTPEKRLITLKESDALRSMPGLNPQALIAAAIDKGASIETLERLVGLAKDIRAITALEAYNEAIAEFQRRCPPIKKNKEMIVPGRPKYKYADLGEILSTIGPLMGELGLSVSWRTVQSSKPNHIAKVCEVSHRLGHTKDSGPSDMPYNIDGNRMNPAQSVGSAETYAKRYSLCSVLGISPEDDTDANDTHGKNGGETSKIKPSVRQYMAETEPDQPPAPDDPALVKESVELFPDPEHERLVTECGRIIKDKLTEKAITQKDVRNMKLTYLGAEDANPDKCDIAALTDLRKYLAARFEKASAL
jgi:ERF superfamily